MKEYIVSDTTGKRYSPSDVVRIVNFRQAAAYIKNGAQLLDIYASKDFKKDELLLVYIFNRKETTQLYDLWCKHELK